MEDLTLKTVVIHNIMVTVTKKAKTAMRLAVRKSKGSKKSNGPFESKAGEMISPILRAPAALQRTWFDSAPIYKAAQNCLNSSSR